MSPINLKTILIIVAMDIEEEALIKGIKYEEVTYGNRFQIETKQFTVNDHKIIIANSGIGAVNAALVVTFIYEHEDIDAILVLGVGGALCPTLKMGDTIIAEQIIQHDSIASTENGHKLIAAGELTLSAADEDQIDPIIKCSSELRSWLATSFKNEKQQGRVHVGTILSGSEFVANSARKKELYEKYQRALLVEMESGGIAQVARKLEIPFAVIKTVADHANPNSSISEDYLKFLKQAAVQSGTVMKAILSL